MNGSNQNNGNAGNSFKGNGQRKGPQYDEWQKKNIGASIQYDDKRGDGAKITTK